MPDNIAPDFAPFEARMRRVDVLDMLEHITPGAGGELQLTDGIKALLTHEKVYGYSYEGKRHDAGDKQGFLRATVEFALKRDDLGPAFRDWLKSFPL